MSRFRRYRQRRVPYFSRPKNPHDWHWVVAGIGKALIVVGLLMFAFVGYQLWGTGIRTAQAQNRLEDEFNAKLESVTTVVTTTTTIAGATTVPGETTTTTVPTAAPSEPVPEGEPVAILRIPKIGIEWRVVEGVSVKDLQDGPGHFRESVMPGQLGNSAIAGHRTTHGQPFRNLDQLEVGDLIEIETLVGTYTYAVTGSVIVKPSDYALVVPTVDPTIATLILATCDPAYTARNRLVVRATLVPESSDQVYAPAPATPPSSTTVDTIPGEVTTTSIGDPTVTTINDAPDDAVQLSDDAFTDGWFSDSAAIPHVLGWGVLLLAVGFGSYFAGRAAKRLYVSFLVGAVPFIFVLYFWFENVNRLLPPGL
ncbi:MAG: class E sortase [Ilumatobacteraceae bacterium]